MAHCLPIEWVASLKQVEAMDIDRVVPGHGEISDIKEVQRFRPFIETCIEMTTSTIGKGVTRDEAADHMSFEALYPGHRCGPGVHPGLRCSGGISCGSTIDSHKSPHKSLQR